jgi:hypothetical protein
MPQQITRQCHHRHDHSINMNLEGHEFHLRIEFLSDYHLAHGFLSPGIIVVGREKSLRARVAQLKIMIDKSKPDTCQK